MKQRLIQLKKFTVKLWWLKPLVLVVGACFTAWVLLKPAPAPKTELKVVDCVGAQVSDFKCWEQRYEAMTTLDSPKAALKDIRQAYEKESFIVTNCHQLSHVIGRAAGKKFGDVSKAYAEGDNFCWSGYYHGVMEAIALITGPEKVLTELNTICEQVKANQTYSFYHYNCVHGLGHGVMAIENNELFTALNDCDKFNDSWERESCFGGAFMENVMSSLNPEHKTQYIKSDDPLYPCTAVEERHKTQCYLMQTSHALTVVNQDYAKVFELCGTVGSAYEATCYQSLGRDASGSTNSNIDQTKARCLQGPTLIAQENCVIGAVKDFLSYHHDDKQGLALCNSLPNAYLSNSCILTAQEYYKTF